MDQFDYIFHIADDSLSTIRIVLELKQFKYTVYVRKPLNVLMFGI